MDKRFFVFYALIAAVILWLVLPNSLFGLFAAMLIAVGCGVLESVQPLFRPASFAGTAMALVLLVGRTGVLPGVLGTVLITVVSTVALCLLALAVAALERETLGSPLPAWAAIVLLGAGGVCTALLSAGLFPAAASVIVPYVDKIAQLGKIVLLVAVFRAQSAVIRKGEFK